MSRIFIQENEPRPWRGVELITFRLIFLFILLLTIPFHWSYYENILAIHPFYLKFQDLFQISHHIPGIPTLSGEETQSFSGWIIAAIVATIGTLIWTVADRNANNYDRLYYWTRAALRYRLAGGTIAYGLLLLIPVLIPAPTISDLHTAYGDFLPWKIYYHSTAVASAAYRQTIGFIQILGGLLLLRRRTVVFGSIIILFILVNVVLVNFAYDIGEHLYSTYLLLLAALLLVHDLPRLYTLIVLGSRTAADKIRLQFNRKEIVFKRIVRSAFAVFSVLFVTLLGKTFYQSNWPYPDTPGLSNAQGYYNVRSFRINDSLLPYSATDPIRWTDVVFEKWNVLSIRNNSPYPALLAGPEIVSEADNIPHYESLGNGGRNFYRYNISDKNIDVYSQYDSSDHLRFTVQRPDSATIILQGKNKAGDSLLVTLNKVNKDYLLYKGRRKPLSVY